MAKDIGMEITLILKEYTSEVESEIEKLSKEIADESIKELKATSPKLTGKYAKGWSKRKQGSGYIIYNKNKPGLTHLLEKGHAKRGGVGRVAGIPHIEPVEAKAMDKFEKGVERIIKESG